MTPEQIVSGVNLIWIIFSLIVSIYFMVIIYRGRVTGLAAKLAVGILLVAFGTGFHRTFWLIWNVLIGMGERGYAETMASELSHWSALLSVSLVVLGYSLHVSRPMGVFFGKWWLAMSCLIAAIVFFLGASLPFLFSLGDV